MKLTVVMAALLALALVAWPPAARSQASIVDSQMEVTTALVQSSITTEAIKKADDAKCRELQARIDALAAQVKAGKAKQADLTAAKEALVARLGETDAAYRAEIAAFRGAVTDIAATPAGLAALARYNAGDQVGALAILDKLQAAYEKATDIQKAVGERHIAALALDARDKGKVTTDSVIARYEAVVKLDPGVFTDWVNLDRLYQSAGRTADARSAAETAAKVADNDRDKSVALSELGDVLTAQGDLTGAGKAYVEDLAILRPLAAADPTQAVAQRDLSVALAKTGDVLRAQGDLTGASKAYAEVLAIFRRLAAPDPTNAVAQRDLLAALQRTGSVLRAQGDLTGAGKAYAEDLAILRSLAAADPTNAGAQRDVGTALDRTGEVLQAQRDLAGAGKAYAEALAILRPLAAADPTNAVAQRDASVALGYASEVLEAQGDLAGAGKLYAEMLAIFRRLAVADPTNAGAQRDVMVDLFLLARTGSPDVHWSDVVAQMETMDAKGILAPADRHYLDQARANAAKEAAK
jgi:tetratricopeptide (TPR) repeat protein